MCPGRCNTQESGVENREKKKVPAKKKKIHLTVVTLFKRKIIMWVNVLLFLVALVAAAYFYITRHVGWFKTHGIDEIEYVFPFVSQEFKEAFTGKIPFVRVTSEIYNK